MDLAELTLLNPPLEWERPTSHPKRGSDEARWRQHLRATFMLMVLRDPPDRIAAFFDVDRATIFRWRDRVLASDRPEAEGLRRLAQDVRRGA